MQTHNLQNINMKEVIPPVPVEVILSELTIDKFIRKTNNGGNEIYIISDHDSPNTMQEIGRLREISFREGGGGTSESTDIDEYDRGENAFKQLIVWNPIDKAIVGGYRFIHCKQLETDQKGQVKTPTAKLFHYSEKFIREYIPYTIELGRSFVQPAYQPMKNLRRGIYSLDNLWDGLGALVISHPDVKYFFGKVTMYGHFNVYARDLILYFMNLYFPDPDRLVYPHTPLALKTDPAELRKLFYGNQYGEDYKVLNQEVRKRKENIPPLVSAYMSLSPSMRTFGTAFNESFGKVEETGIIVTIKDIYDSKKERHLNSHQPGQLPLHLGDET